MKKFILPFLMILVLCIAPAAVAEAVDGVVDPPASVSVTFDITSIVLSAAGLVFNILLALIARKLIPPLKGWLEERTTVSQRESLWTFVVRAVEAAEQVIGAGNGCEKLEYVRSALRDAGFDVDDDLIEAAVKEMKDKTMAVIGEAFTTYGDDMPPDREEESE